MIAVSGLAKSFGSQALFEDASFQLNPGCRYGLVGANGSGKSTLLRLLSGEELPSDGLVSIPKRLKLGVLQQDHFKYESTSILDVVLMGNAELWDAMQQKAALLEVADKEFDADRYSELEDIVVRHDGYSVEAQAGEILEGLGIATEVHPEPMSTLSGGFRLRVLLAQALASRPDALLLDEPTNHLDILSIRWLEKFLQTFAGIVVVISHDHRFLDNVCTHILDVDYETVTLYPGDYTSFSAAKSDDRVRKEKELAKREKEIAHHQAFVERFRAKATKARQAQSKLRLIEKKAEGLERLPQTSRRYPTFAFRQRRPSGKSALELEGISKSYGENRVLENVSLAIRRGERVAVIGPNGIGKSTLLKIAVGTVAADAGSVEWGHETYPGYFAQDHKELLDETDQTVEGWLWESCPGETVGFVRSRLGQVLFSKDEVRKRVGNLSGGEAARLIFARLGVEEPNVLVLDEPTNHLDLEAIEALVAGLLESDGTLVFVSHDRWFVSRLATRVIEIRADGPRDFLGSYEEYVERCGDDHLDTEVALRVERRERRKKKARTKPGHDRGSPVQKLVARRDELTEELESAETRLVEIDETFSEPGYYERASEDEVSHLKQERTAVRARIDGLMTRWEQIEEEIASAKRL